jgi:hypothetical protein
MPTKEPMTTQPFLRSAFLAVLATLLLAACGTAPEAAPHDTPPPPVTSVAQADLQLAAVKSERAAIETRYVERERVCYTKFFVNNCLDAAKEQRRTALSAQRAIEVQANQFKRRAVVEDRDRQVAEAERRFQEQEAKLAAEPPKPTPTVKPEAAPRQSTVPQRKADLAQRLKADEQRDARDAASRAQKVKDFEARKAESVKSQKRVAERKAERAAKAAKDAEEAKAKAAQSAGQAK